jgi:hypothetical protein
MPTISTSQVAAPAFIAAATGRKVYQGFQLAGEYVHFTDMTISRAGGLVGRTVGDVQSDKRINIVMHQGAGGVRVNPDPQILLDGGDTILVIAPMEALLSLESMNQAQAYSAKPAAEIAPASQEHPNQGDGAPLTTPLAGPAPIKPL